MHSSLSVLCVVYGSDDPYHLPAHLIFFCLATTERRYTVGARLPFPPKEAPKFRIDEVDYDCTDGGDIHATSDEHSPVMWMVTEGNE